MIKSLKAKLISTIVTIAGVASVFAFAVVSFAWYHSYTKDTANDMNLKTVVSDNVTLDIENFWVYGKDDAEGAVFKTKDLTLRTYNLLELSTDSESTEDDNIYNKRFYRIHIDYPNHESDNNVLSIKLQLKKDGDGNISPLYTYTNAAMRVAPQISNVIQFKVYDNNKSKIDVLDKTDSNLTTIYEQCVEELNDVESLQFVNSNSKSEFIEFKLNLETNEKSTDLIIEADYSVTLMENFIDSYQTSTQEGYEYIIANPDKVGTFEKDIEAIYFDLVNE